MEIQNIIAVDVTDRG